MLLFCYGMPFRVRTSGSSIYVASSVDPKELRAEHRAEVFGWIGLILIVLGTAAQIWAVPPLPAALVRRTKPATVLTLRLRPNLFQS
jgi:hypothetical protein